MVASNGGNEEGGRRKSISGVGSRKKEERKKKERKKKEKKIKMRKFFNFS